MNKDVLTSKQIIYMMILFILGSSLVTGGNTEAKEDSWVSIILAIIMAIPFILVYISFYSFI